MDAYLNIICFKIYKVIEFPGGQGLGSTLIAEGPSWRTKISQAMWCGQNK